MALASKVARKVKRAGKSAYQFRCTSIFEYIELDCKGTWRPDELRVLWQRSNRKANSIPVKWVASEDRGPQGASGKATFDVQLKVSLIITLYQDAKQVDYKPKEYKYIIENVGPKGVKQLASFTCNMAEYVAANFTSNELEMKFNPTSEKISRANLGITIESELIKKGSPDDADMQSTYSSMSVENTMIPEGEDEDEETHKMVTPSGVQEEFIVLFKSSSGFHCQPRPDSEPDQAQREIPSDEKKMKCKCGKVPCQCKMDTEMKCKCGKVPCQCKMGEEAHCKCGKTPCQCKMPDSMPTEQELGNYRQMAGYLYKQGIKGLTRNQWRKRYFRFEYGNRLTYYKSIGDATPKGYIDLKRVTDVIEVPRAQQDKNRATFMIVCEGRTFRIQAETEADMKNWVTAVRSLARVASSQPAPRPS